MDNFWYLFAAYTLIMVGLFIYIFSLSSREKQLGDEILELKEMMAQDEGKKSNG